jgi:hypothetical protein
MLTMIVLKKKQLEDYVDQITRNIGNYLYYANDKGLINEFEKKLNVKFTNVSKYLDTVTYEKK